MQVIFIHHSCFLVEVDEKVLIFDWFAGDRIKGYTFHGVIPEYEPDTPIYVFASHKHQDHFDMDVLHWAEKYKNIHYIFSKDCKMSPHFLQKHGFLENIREKITYVSAGEKYQVDDVKIETLRSTDAGVAFYVETHGATFFHAGDLNDWTWEGAGDLINGRMRRIPDTDQKTGGKTDQSCICSDGSETGCRSGTRHGLLFRDNVSRICVPDAYVAGLFTYPGL